MADVPSNYLTTLFGNEQPFSSRMTTTDAVALVSGGNNGARVTLIRVAEVAAVSSTTLRLDILDRAGTSSVQIRPAKALAVGEVYRETDVRLMKGEVLRATASISSGVNITGLYIKPPGGPV
jgi:hypothetical protein